MPAITLEFPATLYREQSLLWRVAHKVITPGQTASGILPGINTSGGGLWRAIFNDISVRGRDQILAFEGFAALADDAVTPFVLRRKFFKPRTASGLRKVADLTGLQSPFTDFGVSSEVVTGTAGGAAALRATTLTVDLLVAGAVPQSPVQLKPGHCFSIQHTTMDWRLYRIASVVDNGGGSTTVSFNPPLRQAIADNAPIEFEEPRCVMKLAQEGMLALPLVGRRFGSASPEFVEHFDSAMFV